jgi:hypothetical protein
MKLEESILMEVKSLRFWAVQSVLSEQIHTYFCSQDI